MATRITYPHIDMQRTRRKLKRMIESAGYTPRITGDIDYNFTLIENAIKEAVKSINDCYYDEFGNRIFIEAPVHMNLGMNGIPKWYLLNIMN